jgi:hypothetical protein
MAMSAYNLKAMLRSILPFPQRQVREEQRKMAVVCVAPGPKHCSEVFDAAVDHYNTIERDVARGLTSWPRLTDGEKWHLEEAVRLWREAAMCGVKEAMFNLALMYWHGRGVQGSITLAMHWFRLAASLHQNCKETEGSIDNIVFMVEHFSPSNDVVADDNCKRGLPDGLPDADYNLSVMYKQGRAINPLGEKISAVINGHVSSVHFVENPSKFAVSSALNDEILKTTSVKMPVTQYAEGRLRQLRSANL